jgi:hypothetical protein
MLVPNPKGNFSFVKGISPYSGGAAADPGYEIEHVTLAPAVKLDTAFDLVAKHLAAAGRPKQALCGMELRSPRPFTFQGFSDFNKGYVEVLKSWGIPMDGLNPVARTNVAPEVSPPAEPSLYGFSYTVPSTYTGKTFVVAGAGELPEGSLDPHDVVRRGETTGDALIEKARFVMGLMAGRMHDLGVTWNLATVTDIYTIHNIHPYLAKTILEPMGEGRQRGVTWHYSRPPIVGIEYEMDVRGVRRETVLGKSM